MKRFQFLVVCWAAFTAVLCLGDHFFHARTGILRYHWAPMVDGQSVWVWLSFAAFAAALVAATVAVPLTDVPATVPWARIGGSTALFVAAYGISGVVGETHPTAFFAALVVLWAVRVALLRHDRAVWIGYGIALAVVGVICEGVVSMAGLFDYRLQQIVDCPWWLAGLYLHGSFPLLQINRGAKALERVVQPA